MATAPRLLLISTLLVILLASSSPSPSAAKKFVVGDKKRWAANVNYTTWADSNRFHVGDWLVFYYRKGMYDVLQVNETAYKACDNSHPILSYSRGHSFPFELNRTGRFHFICGRGYCWNGMKLSVLVEERPVAPAAAPSASKSSAPGARTSDAASGVSWALAALLGAAVLGLLPFPV